jgi:hypothetical protein
MSAAEEQTHSDEHGRQRHHVDYPGEHAATKHLGPMNPSNDGVSAPRRPSRKASLSTPGCAVTIVVALP